MNKLENIFPKEFIDIIDSGWYDDDGGIFIEGFECIKDDLKVKFTLYSGDEDIQSQLWELYITGLKSQKINIKWENNISFHTDHFLLWEFTENWLNLYYNGKTVNRDNLLADIFRIHREQFGQQFEIEKYLNNCMNFSDLCNSDFGLFATGPKKILDFYFSCLEKHNKKPYYQTPAIANIKNKEDNLLGLLIIGDSYFIGQDFILRKVE